MIRLSVTQLDSYRYWRDNEDAELAPLLAQLRGEEEIKPQMAAGVAFHKVLEGAAESEVYRARMDGWTFDFAIDTEIALPHIRELKGEIVLASPSGPVTLVGKVDGLDGLCVRDYKLTERFDAERYADSLQWRAYLAMFNARRFDYEVFVGAYEEENHVRIYDYHRMSCYAYEGMRADVERAAAGLAELVVRYVPERVAA